MTTVPQDTVGLPYSELIRTMEQCSNLYVQLIEAAETKRQLIMAGRDDELANHMKAEHALLDKYAECEGSMRNAALKLQRALGLESDEGASLTELRCLLAEEQQAKLHQMQHQLNQLAKRLHELNEHNQLLMKQHLALIHDMLDAILGSAESDYIYDHPKAEAGIKRSSGIDFRM